MCSTFILWNIIAVLPSSLPQFIMLARWISASTPRWSFSIAAPPSFWKKVAILKDSKEEEFARVAEVIQESTQDEFLKLEVGHFNPPSLPQTKFCEFTYYLNVFERFYSFSSTQARYSGGKASTPGRSAITIHTPLWRPKKWEKSLRGKSIKIHSRSLFFGGGGPLFQFCHVLSFLL